MPQDNIQTQGWPDVPADVVSWPFFTTLRAMTHDIGANAELRATHALQRRTLLCQLKLMSNTQCKACGGYAHRSRDCPTNLRHGMLSSSSNEWKRLIAWARRQVDVIGQERSNDAVQQPAYHSVPVCLGRKRTFAMAFKPK